MNELTTIDNLAELEAVTGGCANTAPSSPDTPSIPPQPPRDDFLERWWWERTRKESM